jgi:hypothetical protein
MNYNQLTKRFYARVNSKVWDQVRKPYHIQLINQTRIAVDISIQIKDQVYNQVMNQLREDLQDKT